MDEAGCVLESCVPVLLLLQPSDMVLLGDHKQLPAFSAIGPEKPKGSGLHNHCRRVAPWAARCTPGCLAIWAALILGASKQLLRCASPALTRNHTAG
jgi:hypothetical protein